MDFQSWLIAARYFGTLPYRKCRNRIFESRGCAPLMVLFYHRVADTHPNQWTISTKLFERQMRWLRDRFDVISLREAQQRIRRGTNSRMAVSITFDDGYADNCDFAIPLLHEWNMPCTYFISSYHMLTGDAFPHDVKAGVPLAPNTPEQVAEMAEDGVDIGAHTRVHADLGALTDEAQIYQEIVGSGDDLAAVTSRPVRYFAFPYGQLENMPANAFRIAKQAGYRGVCAAYGGYNFGGQSAFFLKRIHADPEMNRFRNWLTFDQRKHAMHADIPGQPLTERPGVSEPVQPLTEFPAMQEPAQPVVERPDPQETVQTR